MMGLKVDQLKNELQKKGGELQERRGIADVSEGGS